MREYEERKRVGTGIIRLLSDMEMDAFRMYALYKVREDIELAFDAIKNTLDAV